MKAALAVFLVVLLVVVSGCTTGNIVSEGNIESAENATAATSAEPDFCQVGMDIMERRGPGKAL